jgi:predicted N-acyltransferase
MVDSTPVKAAVRVVNSLAQVKREEWQALAGTNPFVGYDFLRLLETSGCASSKTGWSPRYLLAEESGRLVGATAAYLKAHSRGEFVFDHSWAQAFERHGLEYYPKLVVSVPFTPVQGPRLLANSEATRKRLAKELIDLAQKSSASSVHALFIEEADRAALSASGFMTRESVQFHWQNNAFKSLDGFLGTLTHDKRKKIRQDSRYVAEAGITFRWLTHEDIQVTDLQFFYACYVHTYREHWSTPYLSFDFFVELHRTRAAPLVLVLAVCDGAPVACALNVLGDKTLYGRYWGTTRFVRGLHFETCYLQAIAFCIENQVEVFEGGAQGEHKMARGLMPVKTYSAHWISNRRFATAIEDFLVRETEAVDEYVDNLVGSAPFRQVRS